jgi:hypothetical protein
LWIHPLSRLNPKIEASEFEPQKPEGTVIELRDFLNALEAEGTVFTCDHVNNYIRIQGKLMQDKQALLDYINKFLALPDKVKASHYESIPSVI